MFLQPCFSKNLELTNLNCPFCKKRIGTWHRRAKDVNTLIDIRLWNYLKENFSQEVNARLNGETSDDATTEGIFNVEFSHNICESGQIGQEFQSQIKQIERENQERLDKEELKSKALIEKIQREELMTKENDSGASNSPHEVLNTPTTVNISDVQDTPAIAPEFDEEFMAMQKIAEKRILQAKLDEEYAKKLQDEEQATTSSFKTPVSTRSRTPKRPKGPRQLTLEETIKAKRRRIE